MERLVSRIGNRISFFLLMSGLLISCFLKYVFNIGDFSAVLIAIPVLIAVVGDRDEIIAMCVCCIPFYSVLPIHYVVVISIFMYLCKYFNDVKLDYIFILIILLVMWEITHCFEWDLNIKQLVEFVIPYAVLIVLISIRNIEVDYCFIVRVYSIAVCFVYLILIVRLLISSGFNLNMAFSNVTRLGLKSEDEVAEVIINPNSLGFMCSLGITGLAQLNRFGQKKSYDMYIMITMLIAGALTLSKTYLVCLIIMAMLFFISIKGDIKKKAQYLLGCVSLTLVAVLAIYFAFPSVIETFAARFCVDDITSGRTDLFNQYNAYLFSSPNVLMYGVGVLDFRNKLTPIINDVPHNCIQEILIAWGIPGFFMFFVLIVAMIWRSKKENTNQTLVNYIPLILLLIKCQVGQMIGSTYTMLAFEIVYLSLCQNFNQVEQ